MIADNVCHIVGCNVAPSVVHYPNIPDMCMSLQQISR